MSLDFKEIFSKNLKVQLNKNNMTQVDLAKRLDVSSTAVHSWIAKEKVPRMDKVDKMCEIFGVERDVLLRDLSSQPQQYYIDEEAAQMAQEIHDNPQLKVCFDAIRNVSAKDLARVEQMIKILKGTNNET